MKDFSSLFISVWAHTYLFHTLSYNHVTLFLLLWLLVALLDWFLCSFNIPILLFFLRISSLVLLSDSFCFLPSLVLESAISPRSPFIRGWCWETKIWVLGILTATVSLPLCPPKTYLGNRCMHTHSWILTYTCDFYYPSISIYIKLNLSPYWCFWLPSSATGCLLPFLSCLSVMVFLWQKTDSHHPSSIHLFVQPQCTCNIVWEMLTCTPMRNKFTNSSSVYVHFLLPYIFQSKYCFPKSVIIIIRHSLVYCSTF